jgi:A/G-specific adenine glycosylase
MQELKEWFLKEARDLPWRKDRTPYRVWIAEVMLQQTQVSVVIPYFHRWMKQFPTIEALAQASEEEVLKCWEGLGYYSRARNLIKAAHIILKEEGGVIPSDPVKLRKLPGFGPYTVGAVLSFAFQKKAPAVDGNVVRVLSRLFAVEHKKTETEAYQKLTLSLLPEKDPWIVMEALIELGATVCQKKPKCFSCPLIHQCRAYRLGKADEFPIPGKKVQLISLKREVAVILCQDAVLIRKEREKKVMAGLYEFPYVEQGIALPFQIPLHQKAILPIVKHGFTRYDVTLFTTVYETEQKMSVEGYEWKEKYLLSSLPFSAGHKRILELLNAYLIH